MADFHRKKLQVFVSSTYNDLIQDRQAAVEAILTAGHIPAGMELFTAGDDAPCMRIPIGRAEAYEGGHHIHAAAVLDRGG